MAIIEVQLNSGHKVGVLALYQSETYAGLSGEGPSPVTNNWEQEGARHKAQELWPYFPIYMMQPEMHPCKSGHERLPSVTCMAFLEAKTPVKRQSNAFGSYLVIIFYQDTICPPFSERVFRDLCALNWDNLAQDRTND